MSTRLKIETKFNHGQIASGLIQTLKKNNASCVYFYPKYTFGVNSVKVWFIVWTHELKKYRICNMFIFKTC